MKSLRSQIRKLIAEASINDKGELVDFEAKTKYPHKKIGKFIGDYINSNFEDWAKMGWSVFDSDYSEYDSDIYDSETGSLWRVEKIDDPDNWDIPVLITLKNEQEAFKKAKEAGFILDDNGVILGLWGINMFDSLTEEKKPLKRVAGALIQDEQTGDIFLIKRNDKTPKWAMVTGKIDEGEDPIDALEREMYEELFIRPEEGKVRLNYKGVESFPAQNMELYYFEGFVNGKFNPILDEENLDYGWFSVDTLPSPLIGGVYGKIKDISKKDKQVSYFEPKPQLNEIRKQIRLIMEQKIMPKYYMQEAVNLIKEAEEKSPTYQWDFIKDDEKSPTYNWDLTNKGIKDEPSQTYHWDLSPNKTPQLNSYDQAREYIDKALTYIKDKASAIEFIKDLKNYIKGLSTSAKIKLTKYVATALLGIIGLTTLTTLMSSSSSEVERDVAKTIVTSAKAEKPTFKGYPTEVSDDLVQFLKDEEQLRTTFYDLGDGAYTVGWGHAVFASPSKGSTGGDYPFIPKYKDIIPDVTSITKEQAEQLLRDDINKAKRPLDNTLARWESEGIKVNIDQEMYDAMVSMIYNMGAEKFLNSDFIYFVKDGKFKSAYNAIDHIDHPNLIKKFPGLKHRRDDEQEIFGTNLGIAKEAPPPSDISEVRKLVRKTINNIV